MLCQLDDRSRCAVFAEVFLQRFYTQISSRQNSYQWMTSMPAIVDTVGMSLAQDRSSMNSPSIEPFVLDPVLEEQHFVKDEFMDMVPMLDNLEISLTDPVTIERLDDAPQIVLGNHFPASECDSIASFMNTYQRTLQTKLNLTCKSGRTTPGDLMSLTSSADFKFGMLSNANGPTDTDSVWQILHVNETSSVCG